MGSPELWILLVLSLRNIRRSDITKRIMSACLAQPGGIRLSVVSTRRRFSFTSRSLTRSAIQRESADLHNQHKTLAWQKDTIVAQVRPGEMWQEWVQNASAWCFTERVPGFSRNFWNWSSVVANRRFSIRFSGRRKLSDLTKQRGCELSGKRA